ncbi:MAG: hypothetical protein IT462_12920 [Planctomycetes bacterium]|nr:hypothetical protein [Planctomycetota bacterium]
MRFSTTRFTPLAQICLAALLVAIVAACNKPADAARVAITPLPHNGTFVVVTATFPPRATVVEGKGLDYWLTLQGPDEAIVRGEYALNGDQVTFTPAMALDHEKTYRATLRLPDGSVYSAEYTAPEAPITDADIVPIKVNVDVLSPLDPLVVTVSAEVPSKFLAPVITQTKGARLGLRYSAGDKKFVEGTLRPDGARLLFRPNEPLQWDTQYTGSLTLEDGRTFVQPYITPPRPNDRKPVIANVYPSSTEIPANNLKFYVCFSEPMQGEVLKQCRILDDKGAEVWQPWQEKEIWSVDRARLKLVIHPGRIKRDLRDADPHGPVLVEGRKYTLVIAAGLKSALGAAMEHEFRREYTVAAEDREFPVPEHWKKDIPKAGTREPLVLKFGESLDYVLALSCIEVQDANRKVVLGEMTLGGAEKTWSFVPAEPWSDRAYFFYARQQLEDLAGNKPGELFDHRAGEPAPRIPELLVMFTPVK